MKDLLLARTDRIGDVVLTTASFDPLREEFPEARIRILVRPGLAELLSADRRVEAVACPPGPGPKGLHPVRIRRWARFFRESPPEAMVFLHPDNDLQIAAALAGIPRRIGYRKQAGRLALTETVPYRRHLGFRHEALCNFDLLGRIGCPAPAEPRPSLVLPAGNGPLPPEAPPYAAFHPAAFAGKPRWPAAHYGRLGRLVHERFGWRIVLVGAESDPETATALRNEGLPDEAWTDRGGCDDLAATARLLAGARAVVSRDSDPAHLAAALGTPLVCLMGQCDPIHSPRRWAPIGGRVRTLVADLPPRPGESRHARWARCFASIPPEEACAALAELVR